MIGLRAYLVEFSYNEFDQINLELPWQEQVISLLGSLAESENKSYSDERSTATVAETEQEGFSAYGRVRYGAHGIRSDFYDLETAMLQYERMPNHAETVPLYYHFWMPNDKRRGVLITQTYEKYSCATLLEKLVNQAVKEIADTARLRFRRIVEPDAERVRRKPIKQLTLISKSENSDIATKILGASGDVGEVQIIIKPKRGKTLGAYEAIVDTFAAKETILVDEQPFEQVSAEVQVGKNKKMRYGVAGVAHAAATFDITGDVELEDEEPTTASLKEQSSILVEKFAPYCDT